MSKAITKKFFSLNLGKMTHLILVVLLANIISTVTTGQSLPDIGINLINVELPTTQQKK